MGTTVDPIAIPQRALSRNELEDFVFFSVLVANKEATQTRRKLDRLYEILRQVYPEAQTAFEVVRRAIADNLLLTDLKEIRTGQYRRIERAFREVIDLDLDHLTVETLEAVHGIGPKTARFILLYALPGVEVAPLDTHVLKYLRKLGYKDVPKSTPSAGPTYRKWETIFIAEAKKAGMSIRDFDTWVWKQYAVSLNGKTRG